MDLETTTLAWYEVYGYIPFARWDIGSLGGRYNLVHLAGLFHFYSFGSDTIRLLGSNIVILALSIIPCDSEEG
jgi:hypothetical protein